MDATKENRRETLWWRAEQQEKKVCPVPLKPGDTCPACGQGELAYDGLFLLVCRRCGAVAEGGTFT